MGLKPYRQTLQTDVSFFCNDTTATRGGVLVLSTVGSGQALDQADAVVTYATDPSGKVPVGILMNDVVNLDLTRQHLNTEKDEVQTGSKVCILKKGTIETNMLHHAVSISAGSPAYVVGSGLFHTTEPSGTAAAGWAKVGRFLSKKDEDGYAKIEINLPN